MIVDTQLNTNFAMKNLDNLSILHFGYGNMAGVKVKKVDSITSGTAEIGLTDTGLKSNLEYASASVNPRDVVVTLAIEDDNKRDVYDDLQDILYKGAEIALFVGDDFLDGRRGKCGVMKGIMSDVSANRFKKGLQDIQYTIHCVEPYWYDIEDYDIFTKILESWFARAERLSTISFETSFSEASTFALGGFRGNVEDNAQIEVSIDVDSDIRGTLQIGNPSVDDEVIELDCPVNDGKWPKKCTVTVDTSVGNKKALFDSSYYPDYIKTEPYDVLCCIGKPSSWGGGFNTVFGLKNGRIVVGNRTFVASQVLNDSSYGDILCFYIDDDHPNTVRFLTSNKIYGELKWDGSKVYLDETTQEQLSDSSPNTEVIHTATMDRMVVDGKTIWIMTVGGVVYRYDDGSGKFSWASGKKGTVPPSAWTKSESDVSRNINGLSYGLNKYVGAGEDGLIVYSQDGIGWTEIKTDSDPIAMVTYRAITYGYGDKFVAVGSRNNLATIKPIVLYSSDGIEWSSKSLADVASRYLFAVAYGNGMYITGGTGGDMAYSPDGINWTKISNNGFTGNIKGIAYGDGWFVAVSDGKEIGCSRDGLSWTTGTTAIGGVTYIEGVAYGNGMFVAISQGGYVLYASSDNPAFSNWSAVSGVDFNIARHICFGNGYFVMVCDDNKVLYSKDGIAWGAATAGLTSTIKPLGAVYGDSDRFVICGEGGQMSHSNIITSYGDLFSGKALSAYARDDDFIIVTQQNDIGDRTAYVTRDGYSIEAETIWGGSDQAPAYKFCRASDGRWFGASYGASERRIYKADDGWNWSADVSGAFAFVDPLAKDRVMSFINQSLLHYACAVYNVSTKSWDKLMWFPLVPKRWSLVAFSGTVYGDTLVVWETEATETSKFNTFSGVAIPSYWLKPTGDNKRTMDLVLYPAVMGNPDTADKISVAFPNGSGKTGTMKITVKVLERWL